MSSNSKSKGIPISSLVKIVRVGQLMRLLPGVKSAPSLCNCQEMRETSVGPRDEQKKMISGRKWNH